MYPRLPSEADMTAWCREVSNRNSPPPPPATFSNYRSSDEISFVESAMSGLEISSHPPAAAAVSPSPLEEEYAPVTTIPVSESMDSLATTFRSLSSQEDEPRSEFSVELNGDSYNLSKVILGKGYFGTVYLGLSALGSFVAIKVLRETKAIAAEELTVLTQLRHPNIVRYLGSTSMTTSFTTQRLIIMEYVSGGSLEKMLLTFPSLPISCVVKFTCDILLGLAYLHSHRIWHRDIKPQNILVTPDGVCKLADFGMAQQFTNSTSSPPFCDLSTTTTIGSVAYMPPEAFQLQWVETSDVWSVGVTMYQLVTKEFPWHVDVAQLTSPTTIAYQLQKSHWRQKALPPSRLPAEGQQVIQQCLLHEPAERPTAKQLLRHPFFASVQPQVNCVTTPATSSYII